MKSEKIQVIGLTGGIGSGKSTVRRVFEKLGIPAYDADSRAKKLMIENADLISQIKQLLGDEAYDAGNRLNRAFVASQIFNDKTLLSRMNTLVHPAVKADFELWLTTLDAPCAIKEAAILFESGSYKDTDKIIVVTAPEDLRIRRVCERDNTNEETVRARLRNQMSDAEKIEHSDFHILNDETHALLPQILEIIKLLCP